MNSFGNKMRCTVFGASHEEYIGLTVSGFPAGVTPDHDLISRRLAQRRALLDITSKRREGDEYRFLSGIFNGRTTGAPLTFLVKNADVRSADYEKYRGLARPSHADYTQHVRFQGFEDYRGGGIASGRVTVAYIILGALAETVLREKGVFAASRMKSVLDVEDGAEPSREDLERFREEGFPVLTPEIREKMLGLIEEARNKGDSLGGVAETWILGLPAGLGSPLFGSVEGYLSQLIFGIPGAKGIEFGSGFGIASLRGSQANDGMFYEAGEVRHLSNHSGGINGGITNGNAVCFRVAYRPTPTIALPQPTIDFLNKENKLVEFSGRHDAIFAIKALHVQTALANFAALDLML